MLDEINLNSFDGGRTQLTPGASGHHPATITALPRQSFNLIFLSLAEAVAEFSQSNLLSTIHSFIHFNATPRHFHFHFHCEK